MSKRIGGWWRLWIVATLLWAGYAFIVAANQWPPDSWATDPSLAFRWTEEDLANERRLIVMEALVKGFLWPLALIPFALAGRWVHRGFRAAGTE